MTIEKGSKAPDFTLYNSEKKEVSLGNFKGKNVVIHFFPMAFTGTCTEQLCTLRDDLSSYKDMGAEVLGISVDSPFTLAKFKEEQKYNFDLLSDFNKEVSPEYGAFYQEFALGLKGVSKRAAFVVDKDGTVQYAEVLADASKLPDFDKVKEVLTSL